MCLEHWWIRRESIAKQANMLLTPKALPPIGMRLQMLGVMSTSLPWRKFESGQRPFCKLDVLHRDNLDIVLGNLGWTSVDEVTRSQLTLAWHTLDAWPDVGQALTRLRQKFLLAPCSNGHISLMVNLAATTIGIGMPSRAQKLPMTTNPRQWFTSLLLRRWVVIGKT
jgi:2-haloacid dehalogenase